METNYSNKLSNNATVITGAGAGMGKAIAERFASEGAKLVLTDINGDNLNKVATAIQEAGHNVIALVGNIAVEEDVEKMLDTAVSEYGRIDCLVNNAGILDSLTPVADTDNALYDKIMSVNAKGVFFGCRGAVRRMLAQKPKGGTIINVSSIAGLHGYRGGASYTMSKHAVVGLTKNIAAAYRNDEIRCNAICPGSIATDILYDPKFHEQGLNNLKLVSSTMPDRLGTADEIAKAAVFLASDDSSYVNGTMLNVDGGWIAS